MGGSRPWHGARLILGAPRVDVSLPHPRGGVAFRKDGSMSVVVEGMKKESRLIFYTFGIGLLSLLVAVACSTWLLMQR